MVQANLKRRWLPFDEWHRLEKTELGPLVPHLHKERTRIVVVEDWKGDILACWAFFDVLHAEGLWRHPLLPAQHSRFVWNALLDAMHEAAEAAGVNAVTTAAERNQIGELTDIGKVVSAMLVRQNAHRINGDFFAMKLPFGPFARGE